MHRGWAQFSSDRRRPPRRRLFRSVELNVVGWSALLAATGVVAGAGAGVAAAWGRRPLWFAVAASSVVPVVLVMVDRRRAAKIPHSLSWGASPAEVRAVPARLQAEGIAVTVEPVAGVPIDVVDRSPGDPLKDLLRRPCVSIRVRVLGSNACCGRGAFWLVRWRGKGSNSGVRLRRPLKDSRRARKGSAQRSTP